MNYIYTRVSTDHQNETSLEVQEDVCRNQLASINNDTITVIREVGSGKDAEGRPLFLDMISKLKEGDIVAVYDNSRLSRNIDVSIFLLREITVKGAKLLCNGRFIDRDNPQDSLMYNIDSAISTFNRDSQNLRSKEGSKRKYKNGDAIFTGKLLGYSLIKKYGKVLIDIVEEEAKIVRYIFNETIKGKSIVSISNELWNTAVLERKFSFYVDTVRSILRRPLYMGYYSLIPYINSRMTKYTEQEFRDSLVKSNYYPPIISEEDWWKAYYEEQKKLIYNFQANKVKVMFNINMEVQTKDTLEYLRDKEREEEDFYNKILNGEDI